MRWESYWHCCWFCCRGQSMALRVQSRCRQTTGADFWTGITAIPHTAVKNLLLTQLWFCQYEPHLHWRPQLTLLYSIKNASLTQLTFWVKVLQQRCCLDSSLPCAFYTWTEITSELCSPWAGFSKRCLTWHLLSQNYLCFTQTGRQSASFMSWTLRKDGLECPLMFYSVFQTMIKLFCVLFCAN